MNRTGKITFPYPFCLFGAMLSVVLLMGGVIAWSAFRDARASVPARANAALESAMVPAHAALADHFGPVAAQLRHLERETAAGANEPGRQWPRLLLPTLSPFPQVSSILVAHGHDAYWYFERDGATWIGGPSETLSVTGKSWFRWNSHGYRIHGGPGAREGDEDGLNALLATARTPYGNGAPGNDAAPLGSESAAQVYLSAPRDTEAPKHHHVIAAVEYDALAERIAALSHDGLRLKLDPGGETIRQIQDTATLALLQQQAVPGSASVGPALLFPELPERNARWWYAADTYRSDGSEDAAFWILAAADESSLPPPALPISRYLWRGLLVGAFAALGVALMIGRQIRAPLRQIAARARSIQSVDEHYRPWPTSRLTEINALTTALEGLYESAVEHLDYHDAPLVVWAQPEEQRDDAAIETEAIRHVTKVPLARAMTAAAPEDGPVIEIRGDREAIPAIQIQALQGTRREVRRLQGQLAGAYEELRTTTAHREQNEARQKRERAYLRELERLLHVDGVLAPTMLARFRDVLSASRASLWTLDRERDEFHLNVSTDVVDWPPCVLEPSVRLRTVLQEQYAVAVTDPRTDPRLDDLRKTPFCAGTKASMLLLPLKVARACHGFILLEQYGAVRRWKDDEEVFAMAVSAHYCAAALAQQTRHRPITNGASLLVPVSTPGGHSIRQYAQRNGN